ncbi:hypothetical protein [Burkholderia savannae]|uniref:hypothetical protein n=1 Tax=Burkholderia savannae TaxID=1637837 RepID=UPI0012E36DD7|nr:hypothetical protein [Burkholderia savannae]
MPAGFGNGGRMRSTERVRLARPRCRRRRRGGARRDRAGARGIGDAKAMRNRAPDPAAQFRIPFRDVVASSDRWRACAHDQRGARRRGRRSGGCRRRRRAAFDDPQILRSFNMPIRRSADSTIRRFDDSTI